MTMPETLLKASLASGITLALLVGVASAALAKDVTVVRDRPGEEIPTQRVFFGDLNLASTAGERTLNGRVRGAVQQVCVDHQDTHPYINCESFAWSDAKPQISRAIARAREMAATGTTSIAPVAIVIATPK